MYDYDGDMKYYQDQLNIAGIKREKLDMDKFSGLTARELQAIVNFAISKKKEHDLKRCRHCDIDF